MKSRDVFVQQREQEFDRDTLHRRLFPVNMRLYISHPGYKKMIADCINYMMLALTQEYEDYPKLSGVAAANLGIPWNIIVINLSGTTTVMINPEIYEYSSESITGYTNCPSLKLKNKVKIKRAKWVSVRYYTVDGKLVNQEQISRFDGGLSIQHEVDSNNGIMITDRFQIDGGLIANFD